MVGNRLDYVRLFGQISDWLHWDMSTNPECLNDFRINCLLGNLFHMLLLLLCFLLSSVAVCCSHLSSCKNTQTHTHLNTHARTHTFINSMVALWAPTVTIVAESVLRKHRRQQLRYDDTSGEYEYEYSHSLYVYNQQASNQTGSSLSIKHRKQLFSLFCLARSFVGRLWTDCCCCCCYCCCNCGLCRRFRFAISLFFLLLLLATDCFCCSEFDLDFVFNKL